MAMASLRYAQAAPASYLLSPLICTIIGRLLSLAVTVVMIVLVASPSWAGRNSENAMYGGLSACLGKGSDNGWDWHVQLFTIAVVVALTESYYEFTPVMK